MVATISSVRRVARTSCARNTRAPEPGGDGGRRERALEPFLGGQVQALADEVLAGQRHEHGVPERDERLGPTDQVQAVPGVLAEVVRRVDQDAARVDAQRRPPAARPPTPCGRTSSSTPSSGSPPGVGRVLDAERVGARAGTAGVRADDPEATLGGDLDQRRVVAGPGVVDQVRAGVGRGPGDLGTPGVDADQQLAGGVGGPARPAGSRARSPRRPRPVARGRPGRRRGRRCPRPRRPPARPRRRRSRRRSAPGRRTSPACGSPRPSRPDGPARPRGRAGAAPRPAGGTALTGSPAACCARAVSAAARSSSARSSAPRARTASTASSAVSTSLISSRSAAPTMPRSSTELDDPVQQPLPVRAADEDDREADHLVRLDEGQRLEELVERAEPAGQHDEPLGVLHEHRLAGEEVPEVHAEVDVLRSCPARTAARCRARPTARRPPWRRGWRPP